MRSALFKQADIVRAIRAAQQAGLDVNGIEIAPDGTIRVLSKALLPPNRQARDASEVVEGRIRAYRGAKSPPVDGNDRPLADGELMIEGTRIPAHPQRKMRERNYESALADGFKPPPNWKLHPDKKRR